MSDRDPKTAECWHCDLKYADVYTNDDKQVVGQCGSCGDIQLIKSRPGMKLENSNE